VQELAASVDRIDDGIINIPISTIAGGTVQYNSAESQLYVYTSSKKYKQNVRDLSTRYTKEDILKIRPVVYNPSNAKE
jgi:hypothetical protein